MAGDGADEPEWGVCWDFERSHWKTAGRAAAGGGAWVPRNCGGGWAGDGMMQPLPPGPPGPPPPENIGFMMMGGPMGGPMGFGGPFSDGPFFGDEFSALSGMGGGGGWPGDSGGKGGKGIGGGGGRKGGGCKGGGGGSGKSGWAGGGYRAEQGGGGDGDGGCYQGAPNKLLLSTIGEQGPGISGSKSWWDESSGYNEPLPLAQGGKTGGGAIADDGWKPKRGLQWSEESSNLPLPPVGEDVTGGRRGGKGEWKEEGGKQRCTVKQEGKGGKDDFSARPKGGYEDGKGKGGGRGRKGATRDAVSSAVESLVAEVGAPLDAKDFDWRVRQYLGTFHATGGIERVQDALAMVRTYTEQKSRDAVNNWPAYLLTLLKKFEPAVGSAGAPAPAAPAGAAAAPQGVAPPAPRQAKERGEGKAKEKALEPRKDTAVTPTGPVVGLPPGWESGRSSLLEEVAAALNGPRCPFTGRPVDCQATLVAQLTECLANKGSDGSLKRHALGLAGERGLADCPRAAAASAVAGQVLPELASLPDGASAGDAASALVAAMARSTAGSASARAAATVLEDLGLELVAEVLRNPRMQAA
mmetsp:Transcript_7395/g.27060  ORF Transcript_7395/g.27060 Transcript_7395/m.27060 type:complete len:582 (-) Transcript_7395:91-1836(-)